MASTPTPITHQLVAPVGNNPVLAYTVPANTELATLSVRALNDTAASGNYTVWFVPAGAAAPERQHRLQNGHPLGSKATNVDMAISVGPGDRIYTAASIDGIVITINGIGHLS